MELGDQRGPKRVMSWWLCHRCVTDIECIKIILTHANGWLRLCQNHRVPKGLSLPKFCRVAHEILEEDEHSLSVLCPIEIEGQTRELRHTTL